MSVPRLSLAPGLRQLFLLAICSSLLLATCRKIEVESEIKDQCRSGISPDRRVLFIGWDGCRTDALLAAHTPTVDSLMAHAHVNLHTDRGPHTVSVPGWSTLLHGVWPGKHGTTSNSFRRAQYEDFPDVFHYLRAARPELSLATVSHWDDFLRISSQEDYAQVAGSDAALRDTALRILRDCTPDVLLVHFDEIDDAGHGSGFDPANPAYIEAIEHNDRLTGELLQVIEQREAQTGEEWLILLATDHGGMGTGHGGLDDHEPTRFVFLIARRPGATRVDLIEAHNTDVMPTILEYMGVPVRAEWGLDGENLF